MLFLNKEDIMLSGNEIEKAEKVLDYLISNQNGDIKVTCVKGENLCKEGCCDASIAKEGNQYNLVTGIIINADYLGSASFHFSNIQEVSQNSLTVIAQHRDSTVSHMRLEARS
jgi:hypothetical protein